MFSVYKPRMGVPFQISTSKHMQFGIFFRSNFHFLMTPAPRDLVACAHASTITTRHDKQPRWQRAAPCPRMHAVIVVGTTREWFRPPWSCALEEDESERQCVGSSRPARRRYLSSSYHAFFLVPRTPDIQSITCLMVLNIFHV